MDVPIDVIVGYSDWHSFLLKAAGVTHTATGWYQNLRQFSLARFQPSPGGRRPRQRYSSAPLLSCPLINPELQDIYLSNHLALVLSESNYDAILQNGPAAGEANWTDDVSCITHWYSLSALSQRLSALSTQNARIQEAERLMQNALTLYSQLGSQNVYFDPTTGPDHIREWQDSLQEFRALAGL